MAQHRLNEENQRHGHSDTNAAKSPEFKPSVPLTTLHSLPNSHLVFCDFGPRNYSHTSSPIRCLLPLPTERLMLIGHDRGLSVLDLRFFDGRTQLLTGEVRLLWEGESVQQLSILGKDTDRNSVVLALVRPLSRTTQGESRGTIRIYNLNRLVSLVSWSLWLQQAQGEHHIHLCSDLTGLQRQHQNAFGAIKTVLRPSNRPTRPIPAQWSSLSSQIKNTVDRSPPRWTTDYVPFAPAGERLVDKDIVSFALFKKGAYNSKSHTLWAIATKSSIIIYESPTSEPDFRLINVVSVPSTPRSIGFSKHDALETHFVDLLSQSDGKFTEDGRSPIIFVTFEDGRAALLHIQDSTLTEINVPPGSNIWGNRTPSRSPLDGAFISPVTCELPVASTHDGPSSLLILTSGSQTALYPYPLPTIPKAPIHVIDWTSPPTHVLARACPNWLITEDVQTYLQLVAMTYNGIEVNEISLPFHFSVSVEEENSHHWNGTPCGFLCMGGRWESSHRNLSAVMSGEVADTLGSDYVAQWQKQEEGFYGWYKQGPEDYRVFWAGGHLFHDADVF